MAAPLTCPFCGLQCNEGESAMQYHVEEFHPDNSQRVMANGNTRSGPNRQQQTTALRGEYMPCESWIKCTRPGCGEYLHLTGIDEHLGMHEAIAMVENDIHESEKSKQPTSPANHRNSTSSRDQYARDIHRGGQSRPKTRAPNKNMGYSILEYFACVPSSSQPSRPPSKHEDRPRMEQPDRQRTEQPDKQRTGRSDRKMVRRSSREPRPPGRLGTRELGPHAFERRMPTPVRQVLLEGGLPQYENHIGQDGRLYREPYIKNETSGLIPVLSDLCALDRKTEIAYLCHPSVKHIVKLNCDGNFCGYWNIQMLLTYLRRRSEHRLLPNILQIQDTIEQAWDNGICSYGRIETGGVRETRKWIGTHEAAAYFAQTGVDVEALGFKVEGDPESTVESLLDHMEAYFISGLEGCKRQGSSRVTFLPPVYLQRFGHSTTIVGLERRTDGSRNLLVFDPSFGTANAMKRLLMGTNSYASLEGLLRPYRRSDVDLSQWAEFEIVVPRLPNEERQTDAR